MTFTLDQYGNRVWRNDDGQIHRTKGWAVHTAGGDRQYWINGVQLVSYEAFLAHPECEVKS